MAEDGSILLKNTAQKLEKVTEEVLRNQGFNADTEKLLVILEILKEQVPNENTGS
jgi:hypothetical protein